MLQKIIQVGNSAAITIPKNFLRLLNGRVGRMVNVESYPERRELVIKIPKKKEEIEDVIDPEVYKVAKDLLQRYLPAFKELAKR